MSAGDAAAASHGRAVLAFPDEFPVAVLGHPMRPSQMGIVNAAASLGIAAGVEPKQDLDCFPPIGPVALRIQEPQIELHVLTVIRCERVAERRFVQKCRCLLSHQATIVVLTNLVNLLVRLDALFARQGWRL